MKCLREVCDLIHRSRFFTLRKYVVAIVHNILKLRQLPIDDMEKNYGEGKRGQYLERKINGDIDD